jgi:heme exporter protein D
LLLEFNVNEKTNNFWTKPRKGKWGWFVWVAVLASPIFLATLAVGVLTNRDSKGDAIIFAAASSIGTAAVLVSLVGFIRWVCCWRNFRRFLFAVVCVATLIALFYAEENWRGKNAWKKYVRQQEARGERMDFAAFVPPPTPDDQNLALCPLFKPVLDFRYADEQDRLDGKRMFSIIWLDTNGLARLEKVDLHSNMRNYLIALSGEDRRRLHERAKVKELQKEAEANAPTNGWINFSMWQDYYQMGTNLNGANPSNTPAQNVVFALRYVEPDLTEIRREASRRPRARWPVHYELDQPWSILLPHLSNAKRIAMLLQVRAAALLAANQTGEGLADIELGFRLADTLASEPFLISQLVRISCYDAVLQPLKEGLARHQFSDAQLIGLQKQLLSADFLAGYQLAMRCERSINGLWIKMTREKVEALIQEFAGSPESAKRFSRFAYFVRIAPKGWIYQNQLVASRRYDNYILSAVDIGTRTVRPKNTEPILAAKQAAEGPYSALVKAMMQLESVFGDEVPFPCKFAAAQAQVDLARVACALERYRLATGGYPETLDVLAPQFITRLPHDIINGQPLKYRRTENGSFILYSVGWNEKDDGGTVVLSKDGKNVNWKEGDWVWKYPVK